MTIPPGAVRLDAQGIQNPAYAERGIARFIVEQTLALRELAPEAVGSVSLQRDLPFPPSLDSLLGSNLIEWSDVDEPPPAGRLPAVYHVMSPFEDRELGGVWPHWARGDTVSTVVTLYDLIPLIFRERYLDPSPVIASSYRARLGLIRSADQVLAISQCTANDAIEHLGVAEDHVTVIDCGVSASLASQCTSRREAEGILSEGVPGLRSGFLLYVGGDDPRKNMEGLIRAYATLPDRLREEHQLVIVCNLALARKEQLIEQSLQLGAAPGELLLTGYVPDRLLAALYRSCELFVFPSLYEGAGLPILEAMSCGAPVAASGVSSIPEITGEGGASFDPSDDGAIAACIQGLLERPSELERLRARSADRAALYTWERVAERTLEGYERALAARAPSRPRPRKRLAVFTPWPPQASGVATHSRRIVSELIEHADVDVIAPAGQDVEFDASLESVGLWTSDQFDWVDGLRSYDRVLYMLGGSRFHVHVLEAMLARPGAVLAHDVRLVGLYLAMHQQSHPRERLWMEDKLAEMYGDRLSARDRDRIWDPGVYVKNQVFMTEEMQRRAEQIMVHSRYQADVLRLERPDGAPEPFIVSHGIPAQPPTNGAGRERLPRSRGPLVVTYGLVSLPVKRMSLLLAGFARLGEKFADAQLVVVGEVTDPDRFAILSEAESLGIGSRVSMLGRVDHDEYWGVLSAADLAVQLRAGINGGEASGAVCDCIAARVPTIVSAIGWFKELPNPVVLPVAEDCSPADLAGAMTEALADAGLRARIRSAQSGYADANSFPRVAERYAELLAI
jgi:glycosyltransferase involved in cell wall biosynthesis